MRVFFKGWLDLSTKLIKNPVEFFHGMPKSGGLTDPLLFIVVNTMLGVLLNAIGSSISRGTGLHDLGILAIGLIIAPLIAIILSFFVAGFFFAIWSFMGSNESYETSYRCLSYMQILLPITVLLGAVPYLGLLSFAWWFYLLIIVTKEVHKITIKPALLVFGIIAALSGLVYYNSVSSEMKTKEHLRDFTKALQKMPGSNEMGNSGKQK